MSDGSDDARSAILERIARFRTMDEEVPPVWQAKRDLAASVRELLDCICATDAGEADLRGASGAIREMAERAHLMGADAVVGMDLDYEVLGSGNGMLMVTCSGTAVKLQA